MTQKRRGYAKGTLDPKRPAGRDGFKVPKLPPKKTEARRRKERREAGAICGGKKRGGGICNKPSGWGTNHPGIGKCKFHGGSAPNAVKAAASQEYRTLLGKPREINPLDALLECIKIRAGEVQWLSDRMAELDQKHWIEETMVGKQFHLYARERRAAINDLARYSQMAISLGIAERAVKLAETYGELLAALIRGILDDLELTPEQRQKAPGIVRQRLLSVSEGGAQILELPQAAA